jgi:hypothetical protein
MIALFDTFNNQLISTHFTLKNAVIAQRKHLRAIQKYSKNSYLTYGFAESSSDENDLFPMGADYPRGGWKQIDGEEVNLTRMELDNE